MSIETVVSRELRLIRRVLEELVELMKEQQEANLRFAENVIKEAYNDRDEKSNL